MADNVLTSCLEESKVKGEFEELWMEVCKEIVVAEI